jgi:hypothetical protein
LHIEGLLLLGKKDFKGAVVKLREALEAVERRLGRDHWRSKQARFELDQALRTSTAQKPD